MTVAERICENVENIKIEHIESCTGGIAFYEQLIQQADEALCVAKKLGRNKIYHFATGAEELRSNLKTE